MRLDIYGFKGIVLVGGAVFVEVYGFSRYGFSRYGFRGCLDAAWKNRGRYRTKTLAGFFFFDLLNASLLSFQ